MARIAWLAVLGCSTAIAACGGDSGGSGKSDGASPATGEGLVTGVIEGRDRDDPRALAERARRKAAAARRKAAAARRRAELVRLRRSHTIEGALRRALLARRVSAARHARLRADLAAARAAAKRLSGARRAELASVLTTAGRLAAAHALTSDRLEPVFTILRRNTAFWTRAPMPRPGQRFSFPGDPVVYQYYSGQGLQIQPLASWGRANALAAACLRSLRAARPAHPCRRRALRGALDGLAALGARRSGFLAWEYYFAYGGGGPPWISGMTQATAVQALARGRRALGSTRYARAATAALGAFEQPPPAGVSVPAGGGRHYLMYSFSPGLRILNGHLQAVTGLHDMAVLAHSRRARRLYRRGERSARGAVTRHDTGAWSLYSASGRESTLGYHRLVGGFLGNLCDRTRRRAYCGARRRFVRYEREPPRIAIAEPRGLRARRATTVRFSVSKLAKVSVRLSGRRGLSLRRVLDVPRGAHELPWTPSARGRYRLRVEARGPSGPAAVAARTIRVVRPKPKPKPKAKPRRRAGRRGAPKPARSGAGARGGRAGGSSGSATGSR